MGLSPDSVRWMTSVDRERETSWKLDSIRSGVGVHLGPVDELDIGADDVGEAAAVAGFDSPSSARGELIFHLAEGESFVGGGLDAEAIAGALHLGKAEEGVLGFEFDPADPFACSIEDGDFLDGEVENAGFATGEEEGSRIADEFDANDLVARRELAELASVARRGGAERVEGNPEYLAGLSGDDQVWAGSFLAANFEILANKSGIGRDGGDDLRPVAESDVFRQGFSVSG